MTDILVFLDSIAAFSLAVLAWRVIGARTGIFLAIILSVSVWFSAKEVRASDAPVIVVNDFMCGLHRVQVNDFSGLMVDGQPYGDYKTTMLDTQNNYVHQFGEKAELRVTQYNRVAFRLVGETRWAACHPVVFEAGVQ